MSRVTSTELAAPVRKHQAAILIVCLLLVVAGGLHFVAEHWPYRHRNVQPVLEKLFASHITLDHYHRTYFPHPGFVADGLTLRRNTAPDLPPFGTIATLEVQGSWLDLMMLRRRIDTVHANGLNIVIPPVGSRANHEDFGEGSSSDFTGSDTAVKLLEITNAQLDIMRQDGGRYSFPIARIEMHNVRKDEPFRYAIDMRTPKPNGHILANGSFGPLRSKQLGETAASGDFNFSDARLDGIGALAGTSNSTGHFAGKLGDLEAQAETKVTGFAVGDARPHDLALRETLAVNALNGDVTLKSVDCSFSRSVVHASGSFAGKPKATELDLTVTRGRTEDVLSLFMQHRPPIAGPLRLKAHAAIGAGPQGSTFLDRLKLDGHFDLPTERLTNPSTEKSIAALSQRSLGQHAEEEDQQDVLSSLTGTASIRAGVVHATDLRFVVPGTVVSLHGTYNLRGYRVDMLGDLQMQADVSHVTNGFKSLLLKPLAPLFKRKQAAAMLPIAITGTSQSPKVKQNVIPHRTSTK